MKIKKVNIAKDGLARATESLEASPFNVVGDDPDEICVLDGEISADPVVVGVAPVPLLVACAVLVVYART